MNAPSITIPEEDLSWNLPARGPVGMYCLIAAEVAIFTIFVIAYIYYIGKSVTGPQPQDVLHVPIFLTICLLASSLTIHLAVRSLRNERVAPSGLWWFYRQLPWDRFFFGHLRRVASPVSTTRV